LKKSKNDSLIKELHFRPPISGGITKIWIDDMVDMFEDFHMFHKSNLLMVYLLRCFAGSGERGNFLESAMVKQMLEYVR
jgi:hypothetical protein